MSPAVRRFELDPAVRRGAGDRLLVGGAPPRLIRLSGRGAAAVEAVLSGARVDAAGAALAARLERAGIIHPVPADPAGEPPVTTIVPALDGGDRLIDLLRTLVEEGPVIVVDDGSRDGTAERAAAAGAVVIPNTGRPGPGGARNTGLRAAGTDLVAFIDADCQVARGWRAGLAGLLESDLSLAVVAPRVRSAPGESMLARYERCWSPLDMGPQPSLVGPRRRITYVPAAALVARRAELLRIGGFDETLRYGEDVDLIWRLVEDRSRVRYVPARVVHHAPRDTALAFFGQRAGYGSSAPGLEDRHGAVAAPLRVGRHVAAVWIAVAGLGPAAAIPVLAGSVALAAARTESAAARRLVAELALRGQADAARHLARALAREWLPATVALAACHRRFRPLALGALAYDLGRAGHRGSGSRERISFASLRLIDNLAYSAGLWTAAARRRRLGSLMPRTDALT